MIIAQEVCCKSSIFRRGEIILIIEDPERVAKSWEMQMHFFPWGSWFGIVGDSWSVHLYGNICFWSSFELSIWTRYGFLTATLILLHFWLRFSFPSVQCIIILVFMSYQHFSDLLRDILQSLFLERMDHWIYGHFILFPEGLHSCAISDPLLDF